MKNRISENEICTSLLRDINLGFVALSEKFDVLAALARSKGERRFGIMGGADQQEFHTREFSFKSSPKGKRSSYRKSTVY